MVLLDGLAATRSAFARGIIGAPATAGGLALMTGPQLESLASLERRLSMDSRAWATNVLAESPARS